MSVNLSKLDISLDQFNAVASGKYNIGQIKLNQDGTGVYRTNNHKTWTIFNTTKINQLTGYTDKNGELTDKF